MSEIAISLSGVSKRYRLGRGPQGRGDFRDAVTGAVRQIRDRWRGVRRSEDDARDLWALEGVSFDVRKGEVVGLIGHNGAGKSTLLRILSRITDPTDGEAWFDGRLGSLLEVGTGFHPELSGRENIFLSGAILGMTRHEIARKFDEIVEFSECGRFLDTPVKRYSSGMYVRLGFAVAAHLDPEILIIDEVLAVGDAAFQRKCLAKMTAVAEQGRTILFVSHNMGSIQSLCDRAIVLDRGRVAGMGDPIEAVRLYLASAARKSRNTLDERADRRGRGHTRMVRATICSEGFEEAPGLLVYGRTARLEIEVSARLPELACRFAIGSYSGGTLCRFSSLVPGAGDRSAGGRLFVCEIPDLPLVPGQYYLDAAILSGSTLEDHVEHALTFNVEQGTLDGRAIPPGRRRGVFAPRHRWIVPGDAA